MKTKGLVLGIVFLLLMAFSIGCSNGTKESSGEKSGNEESNGDKIQLDFVYTGDPAFRQAMDEVLASFSEEHPNIVIKGESATNGSYSEYLRTKDATGEFPDMFQLIDVQEYVDSDKLAVMPEKLASLVENPVIIEDNPYVLPIETNALGYIYNKKFFEENNLNQDPKTYQEFLDVMQQVKDLGETPIAVGGKDVWHMGFLVNHFLINNVYAKDRDWNSKLNNGEASWTDPEPKEAMTKFLDLFHSGLVSENWISTPDNQLAALVTSGKAIGFYSGPWMFAQLKEADPNFEIGFMPVPHDDGTFNYFSGGSANGWAISKEAENDTAKMEAITTFYEYFYNVDVYTKYLEKMGTLPASVAKVTYEAEPVQEKLIDAFNNADSTVPPINEMLGENQIPSSFRDWFYKSVQEWILNDADLEKELSKVDAEWKRLQEQE